MAIRASAIDYKALVISTVFAHRLAEFFDVFGSSIVKIADSFYGQAASGRGCRIAKIQFLKSP